MQARPPRQLVRTLPTSSISAPLLQQVIAAKKDRAIVSFKHNSQTALSLLTQYTKVASRYTAQKGRQSLHSTQGSPVAILCNTLLIHLAHNGFNNTTHCGFPWLATTEPGTHTLAAQITSWTLGSQFTRTAVLTPASLSVIRLEQPLILAPHNEHSGI